MLAQKIRPFPNPLLAEKTPRFSRRNLEPDGINSCEASTTPHPNTRGEHRHSFFWKKNLKKLYFFNNKKTVI